MSNFNENIQPQNIPIDINAEDPDAFYKMAEAFKQIRARMIDLENKISDIESIVLK